MLAIPQQLEGLRVLIVEDESLIAEELRERLTRLGLNPIEVVDTAEAAVEVAVERKPDLVLMDIRLKGPTDGIYAATQIRKLLSIPVVFLTAHSDDETLCRAKESHPHGYVVKPFNERELVITLEMVLLRHGLERQLVASEKRYAAILSSIGDGVITTDSVGRISFLNPVAETLTQWPSKDAEGRPVDEIFPILEEATGSSRENPALEAIRRKETIHLAEPVLLVSRTGEVIPVDDSAAPIVGELGEHLGAVVAFRDIRGRRLTENALKDAQEELRFAQKMEVIGHLAGGLAHDFNNLLTVINCCAELLLEREEFKSESLELMHEIKKAGDKGSRITNQLLACARKQIVQLEVLDLEDLLNDTCSMIARLLGQRIELNHESTQGLWRIRADAGQLEQVLLNLAINARDAMPEGGRLSLQARNCGRAASADGIPAGEYVEIVISDTGDGMDRATLAQIFDPFFTTKEPGVGTGLGLATVYSIIKQSKGFILVESELQMGTTFRILLPALSGAVSQGEGPKTIADQ